MHAATPAPTGPVVHRRPTRPGHDPSAGLVLVLHGRGADERSLDALTDLLPDRLAVTALRAPLAEGAGHAWFANRGVGRPVPASLRASIGFVRTWLDRAGPSAGRAWLLGFSGGATMAGALLLDDPARFAGAVLLSGPLPLDAGLPAGPGRLAGVPLFHGRGTHDHLVPADLAARTLEHLQASSGASLTAASYPRGHGIDPAEVADVVRWFDAHAPGRALAAPAA